jgi:hypothetical protein
MTADPDVMPETIPVPLTVAIAVLLLDQVPPATASLRVVLLPGQTDKVPVMAGGAVRIGLTVTSVAATAVPQEVVTVYAIVTVSDATPVTTPEELMVAILLFRLLHAPPGIPSDRVADVPGQIFVVPEITPADALVLTAIIMVS